MLEIEVIRLEGALGGLAREDVEELCTLALASAGIEDGHLAVQFVDEHRMREVNREHRGVEAPTDVLCFPVDGNGDGAAPGPLELGDILVCPEQTGDEAEAVLHGALHLAGMDHEADDGEMLTLQREILGWQRG